MFPAYLQTLDEFIPCCYSKVCQDSLIIQDNTVKIDDILILYLEFFILFPRQNILSSLQLRGCLPWYICQGYTAGNLHSAEIEPGNLYPLGQDSPNRLCIKPTYWIKSLCIAQ